jgi:hypothetical protein
MTPEVLPGQLWKHENGETYKVLMITNLHAEPSRQVEYPLTVVYKNVKDGRIWSKPLAAFTNRRTLVYQ